jgi:hypothetical protein
MDDWYSQSRLFVTMEGEVFVDGCGNGQRRSVPVFARQATIGMKSRERDRKKRTLSMWEWEKVQEMLSWQTS